MAEEAKDPTEQPTTAAPIDVAAITKSVTEAAVKAATDAVQERLEVLAKDQKVLADTIAAEKPVSPEQVAELAGKAVADTLAQREQAAQAKAQREALIDKVVTEKLGGDRELAAFIHGDDEAALVASADALAKKLQAIKPDFGGAGKEGGTPPAAKPANNKSFKALL